MGAIMAEKALSCIKKYLQTTDAPSFSAVRYFPLTFDLIMVQLDQLNSGGRVTDATP
jgi:hypothetical protein